MPGSSTAGCPHPPTARPIHCAAGPQRRLSVASHEHLERFHRDARPRQPRRPRCPRRQVWVGNYQHSRHGWLKPGIGSSRGIE
jgi:hypothetical protein